MKSISFQGEAKKLNDNQSYLLISIPENLVSDSGIKLRARIKITFNKKNYIHCALSQDKKWGYCIYLGKYFREKAKVELGQRVNVFIEEDTSELGMEMPMELNEVLNIDIEATMLFNELTPGKKRTAMYFIDKAKTEETRIKRSLLIVENIKMGFTKPNQITKKH